MIPPYPFRYYRKRLPAPEDEEAYKSHKRGLAHWLTFPFGDEAPLLCRKCRHRKLDFRPLLKKPPGVPSSYPYDSVEDDLLEDLEMKNAVYINGFLLEEAMNTESRCSLCRLLIASLDELWKEGWLLNMRCICIIRPRYDWVGFHRKGLNGLKRFKIVHLYQIFVQFQPLEEEIIFDLKCASKSESARKGRFAISSAIDTKLLRYWLRQCDGKHSHPDVPASLISRMQAIISRGLFRVINTSTGSVETLTSLPKFVALSYVWGPTANHSKPLESKPISAHAPTIRDSAIIASSVGFKWLWVDRICIDQSSESEKGLLIPYIKDIFATAQLTIVAACGDGVQSGLLGLPENLRKAEKPLVIGSSVAILPFAQSLHYLVEDSVWSCRGWTFEEYVFSRRLLFFLASEVFFSCGAHKFRESLGRRAAPMTRNVVDRGTLGEIVMSETEALHKSLQSKPDNMFEVLKAEEFINALEEYTNRSLTVEEDRVPAFAGVVMVAVTNPMDEIGLLKHGHPLRFFEILLTWQYKYGFFEPRRGVPDRINAKPVIPDKPFAPSWSWASSPVQVGFHSVRNYLLLQWDLPWFQYTLLHNHDILALPTKHNAIPSSFSVGLELPAELITSQPWMKCVSDDLPLDHKARSSTDLHVYNSLSLPILHIVTLVFDARFVYWEGPLKRRGGRDKQFVMVPLDSTETSEEARERIGPLLFDMLDQWSLSPEMTLHYRSEAVAARPQPFETFALITGRVYGLPPPSGQEPRELYFDLYIMLLDTAGQDGTYRRVGCTRLDRVKEGTYFIELIKKGRPCWQYIRIV
ncbi:heterokaryon incompatibility protein-domain-containing protein [Xylaria castorea]|nr:heterokaryon incompatibility protein-domain-containing protein [Xylaria castorea]